MPGGKNNSCVILGVSGKSRIIEVLHLNNPPKWLSGEESACRCRRLGFMGWEDPLEEEMATPSTPSILAWKIPWTEEPNELQFIELQRVEHD